MWMWSAVFLVKVTVNVVFKAMHASRGTPGSSRSLEAPGIRDGRAAGGSARMKRDAVVIAALMCVVVGMPQTAAAAGSYGAVVEKGVRGCTAAPGSDLVICFASPSVNSQSQGLFLQAWRSAHLYVARWDTGPAMLRVRDVSVSAQGLPASPPALTYRAAADLVMPELRCRDEFRFHAAKGVARLRSIISVCEP